MEENNSYMEPWEHNQQIQDNKKFDITMKWHNFMIYFGRWTIGAILPGCAVSIAFFFINKTYYKKRMFLFVND